MPRTKLYKIVIAALVIINVGMLIFFLTGHPGHHPPKAGNLIAELGIEGPNAAKVLALEKDHHIKKRALMQIDRTLHENLFSKLGTDSDVSEIQDKIEANHAEIEKMTYTFFNDISQYCDIAQQKKLKEIIHRAFQQMRKGPKKR